MFLLRGGSMEPLSLEYLMQLSVNYAKMHPIILIFAEDVTVLSQNIIKLIPLGAQSSKYKKSAFSIVRFIRAGPRGSVN